MQYQHRISNRAKRISLKVEDSGAVVVTSPRRVSSSKVAQFVKENEAWIKLQQQKNHLKRSWLEDQHFILIFGQRYPKLTTSQPNQPSIYIKDNKLYLNLPGSSNLTPDLLEKTKQTEIQNFLKRTARHYFPTRLDYWSNLMNLEYQVLELSNQKTRWGSCSIDGCINLNWRLVQFPLAVSDYILVHELAHLTHRNHSKRFYKLVSRFCPHFKTSQTWLRKHGVSQL